MPLLALAACQQAQAPANQAEAAAPAAEEQGHVATAERLVRARAGGAELSFSDAQVTASEGVPVVCGAYTQGGNRQRYIAVGGEEVFLEPQMRPGEMDRAFAEFCGSAAFVIPAKAGISGQKVTAGLSETPAFAGATAWESRRA